MTTWTKQAPTEPGLYWYYGWFFKPGDREPEMYFINVEKEAPYRNTKYITYKCYCSFLYPGEDGAYGLWTLATLPDAPEIVRPAQEKHVPTPFARRDDFSSDGYCRH